MPRAAGVLGCGPEMRSSQETAEMPLQTLLVTRIVTFLLRLTLIYCSFSRQ
jgi:hypothetical protein